ncbi:hypothetical protein ABPG72_001075 [Tetrahymena utriculariae]
MYFKILILSLGLKYILCQTLQECTNLNTYYDLASQNCGTCLENCKLCSDFNSCLKCELNSYYEQSMHKCIDTCQVSQFQEDYFGLCLECQVKNCDICKFSGQLCEKCKQGWQLSIDQKNCLKKECLVNDQSFYNPQIDSCTTNCPEASNQNDKTCVSLKKMSQIRSLSIRKKVFQKDIQYVFYFEQINEKSMIVTLDSDSAILYSYPELEILEQIKLINSFLRAVKDTQNIYLISKQNVQRIDLILQQIKIIYQVEGKSIKSFSQKQVISISNSFYQINIFTFSTGQTQSYSMQNDLSVEFIPYFFNTQDSKNNEGNNSPSQPQSPQNNPKLPLVKTLSDSQGCLLIESNPQQLIPIKKSINMIQRDYLFESQIRLQNQFQNSLDYFENLESSFTYYLDDKDIQLYYLSSKVLLKANNKQQLLNIQILNAFEYDGKIRFVVINPGNYNGVYQSAVVCANLTQNVISGEYYFEYDKPHYAQTTSQIIEFIITENKNSLIIASSQGYEIINISPQQSLIVTESSQNQNLIFSKINNNIFGHSKFLSKSQSIYYEITNDNIQIHLLNFSDQGFSSNGQYKINLLSRNYVNFIINCNQVQIVDNSTFIFSYKNQLIKITISTTNQDQKIQYSSFTQQDSIYYMNGIFKVLYSEDANIMAILFNSGYRIIKVNGQKLLSEKNLRQQIVSAEIVSQLLVIVYQYNSNNYNFIVVNFETCYMYQYEIPNSSIQISLVKQQNPDRLFLGIYYSDSISFFCLSEKKTDVFQLNASPQLYKNNFFPTISPTIQVLNDTVYINTIEYYILVYAYDSVNFQLSQIDNVYTQYFFTLLNIEKLMIANICQNNNKTSIFNRIQKSNYILEFSSNFNTEVQIIQTIQSSKYNKLLLVPLNFLGTNSVYFLDLDTLSYQELKELNPAFSNGDFMQTLPQYVK